MDVLIFCGQSNMQGSTGEMPKIKTVKNCIEYKYLKDEFVPLSHPVGEDFENGLLYGSHFGSLIPPFCKAYSEKKGKVLAIHVARGATTVEEWQKGTERFAIAMDKCKKGIEKLRETEKVGKIYFIWLQGESNAIKKTSKEEYEKLLKAFKNDVKAELNIDKFAIILPGYFAAYASWVEGETEEKKKFDEEIFNAQVETAKTDDDVVILTDVCRKLSENPKFLNPKEFGPHYNNKGMEIIGKRAGKTLAKLK